MHRSAGGVDAMAAYTAHVFFTVGRALHARVIATMAGLAFFIYNFESGCSGIEDQCSVAVL